MDILDIIRDINKELREIVDIKHKYKRRYRKGDKWIYVYTDENGREYTKGEKESGDKLSSVEEKVNKGIISKIFEKFNIKMSENSAGYNNIANCVFALSRLFMKKSSSGNKGGSIGSSSGSSNGNGKVSSGDKEKKPSEADKIMAKFGFGKSSNDIKKQLLLLAKEYAKIEMSGEVSANDSAVSDGDNSGDKDSKIDNNSSKEKEEQSDKDKPVRNYDRVLGDKNKKELDLLAEKMVKNGEDDFPVDIFKSIIKKYKDRLNEDAKKTFDDKEAENVIFMYFASLYEKHQNQLYEKNKEKERELLRKEKERILKEKENKKKEVSSVSLNIGKVEDLLKKRDASSFYEYAINSEKGNYTTEGLKNDLRELRISVNEFLKNKSDSEVNKFIDNNILTDEVVDTLYYRKKGLQAVAGMVNFLKTIKGSDYLVKRLIDKVAIRSDNDSEEVNSIMKSFGLSVRVDDNCVMTKNSRMINDVKKDVNRIDVKGVNVFANQRIINNLNTTESELKSNIEAVYNSLPEYSKNLLKETDSNIYFVSRKDATILSGAKMSDDAVAYYYGLTNDVYFNTTGSMNTLIDYSSVSSAFGDEIATKMITNSGINYILTHELAHHSALADRTRESEGSKQREFNKRIKEISVRSVTEGVDDNYSHSGFVSPYARTNNDEDFAETFAFYATYKEHIDKVIKDKNYNVFGFVLTEKFKFMKEDVWGEEK